MKKSFANTTKNAPSLSKGYIRTPCFAFLLTLALLSGCAGYESRIAKARANFETGQYDQSITELKSLVERDDNDQLLYLMDLGVVYHTAGQYDDALKTFHAADKLKDLKDFTSVSEQVGSVILNDEVKAYRPEDFEKILIHVYLAIDYCLLGKWESALVESRRVNHVLDRMISEGQLPYDRNAFAKYLAAVSFESRGEWNDAFVDYRMLLKWGKGDYPYLPVGLLRMAASLHATQELEEFRKKYPSVQDYQLGNQEGEVILILEQGRGPIKVPHPNFRLMPTFQKRFASSDHAVLKTVDGKRSARSYSLLDIEATAIKDLDHRISGIVAKKVAGVVAKEVIADQVGKQTKSKGLGALTSVILRLTDKADLRHWSTLPASLQLIRMKLPAGRHKLILDILARNGGVQYEKVFESVEIKPKQILFLQHRTRE